MTKPIKIGISTCPNDTFIFDAIINRRIDTKNLTFEFLFTDIKELNKLALNNSLDVIKISFHTFAYVSKNYQILNSGNALGYKCGPQIVSKKNYQLKDLNNLSIAIPGKYTSANLFLKIFFPDIKEKKELLFSQIEEAVIKEDVDCGLIIHESRFTYQEKGLKKIVDLGELWEKTTSLPIPLGGIVAKRSLYHKKTKEINALIKKSIEFAHNQPKKSLNFVRSKAQEIQQNIIQKHIQTYVNTESISLSSKAQQAIKLILNKAQQTGNVPEITNPIFA